MSTASTATHAATPERPRYELPTHLGIEDRVFLGLTIRRALCLVCGLTLTYGLWQQWQQWPGAPLGLRIGPVAAGLLLTLALVFVRPAGRGLEAWGLAVLRYAAAPRASVWRPAGLGGLGACSSATAPGAPAARAGRAAAGRRSAPAAGGVDSGGADSGWGELPPHAGWSAPTRQPPAMPPVPAAITAEGRRWAS
jgi:hypothetical protein